MTDKQEETLIKNSQKVAKETATQLLPEIERCYRAGAKWGYEQAQKEYAELIRLADAMYQSAQYLTTDASRLHKAMEAYYQYKINRHK